MVHSMILRPRKRLLTSRSRSHFPQFDLQQWLNSLGVEFHWPGYNFMGPGTKLKHRLRSGQSGVNRLDQLALIHDIRYTRATSLKAKHRADRAMIAEINKFKNQTWTEWTVGKILEAKVALNI